MTVTATVSRRAFAAALGAAIAAFIAAHPVFANGDTTVFTVAGVPGAGLLQIRASASLSGTVIGVIRNGDQGFVNVSDCVDAKTKKRVSFGARKRPNVFCGVSAGDDGQYAGYACGKYLR